jgi:hypothetical protein
MLTIERRGFEVLLLDMIIPNILGIYLCGYWAWKGPPVHYDTGHDEGNLGLQMGFGMPRSFFIPLLGGCIFLAWLVITQFVI